ncbi:MAG: hypothetical protein KA998_04040, partial [Rickettsiaceae bacterium]|nr:hypothetical protein [Rickettsiaceae bacterium]
EAQPALGDSSGVLVIPALSRNPALKNQSEGLIIIKNNKLLDYHAGPRIKARKAHLPGGDSFP